MAYTCGTVIELVVNETDGAQTLQQTAGEGKSPMILHAQAKEGQTGFPWLVFLHGFSGDVRNGQTVGEAFRIIRGVYIDLPGHGAPLTSA